MHKIFTSDGEKWWMDKGRKGNKQNGYYLNMFIAQLTNPWLAIRDKVAKSLRISQTIDCFRLTISHVEVTDTWFNVFGTTQFTAVGHGLL